MTSPEFAFPVRPGEQPAAARPTDEIETGRALRVLLLAEMTAAEVSEPDGERMIVAPAAQACGLPAR